MREPTRLALVALLAWAGCTFPTVSQDYACDTDADCTSGRVCGPTKFCVIGSATPDAAPDMDAAVLPDAMMPMPDADPFAATKAACMTAGYTMEATTGGLYRAVPNNQSWANAQADCANDVSGATHLIVLSSAAEVAYMKTQLGWVGLTDQGTEDQFRTGTAEANPYPPNGMQPWLNGQPDNGSGSEHCVQMKSGGLDDDQCGEGHRYVCECDGRPTI